MIFENKLNEDNMYFAYCEVIDMEHVSRIRVGEMLFKNKKDVKKWFKKLHKTYLKNDYGYNAESWNKVDYLCYEKDSCGRYVVEHKEFGRWTRHEICYYPIKFAEV